MQGNSNNAKLNGEWAQHVRPFGKRITSKARRQDAKKRGGRPAVGRRLGRRRSLHPRGGRRGLSLLQAGG